MTSFSKYQGTGNDFILIDDRDETFVVNPARLLRLCHRQYGIGADGLILLQPSSDVDYRMRIFNADGKEAEMCGNGLRCIVGFLRDLDLYQDSYEIETSNRSYHCQIKEDVVEVTMKVPKILKSNVELEIQNEWISFIWIDSGVPHLVCFVETLEIPGFLEKARTLRSHPYFSPSGVNVNFAKMDFSGTLRVRTYERGVERETLSCGTGAAAVCVAAWQTYGLRGKVSVMFSSQERLEFDLLVQNEILQEIKMKGPVKRIFTGTLEI